MGGNASSSSGNFFLGSSGRRAKRDESSAVNSANQSTIDLSWTDHFIGTTVALLLDPDGDPLSPAEQRAYILHTLELVRAAASLSARRSPVTATGYKQRGRECLLPLGCISAEYSPLVTKRVMFGCVATACLRLATAPLDMHATDRTWRLAGIAMERVTQGRMRKVQVRLQRRACHGRRTHTSILCKMSVSRLLQQTLADFRVCRAASQQLHRARTFSFPMRRLLLLPALIAENSPIFWLRLKVGAQHWCFTNSRQMLIASTLLTHCDKPPSSVYQTCIFVVAVVVIIFLNMRIPMHLLFSSQSTPLHCSASYGRFEICHLLLQCNASVEAKDK